MTCLAEKAELPEYDAVVRWVGLFRGQRAGNGLGVFRELR